MIIIQALMVGQRIIIILNNKDNNQNSELTQSHVSNSGGQDKFNIVSTVDQTSENTSLL